MSDLDRQDIQGLVLSGYSHLPNARYMLLRITDPARARGWLRELVGEITTGEAPESAVAKSASPPPNMNVAFTASGLRRLGLSQATLASFAPEYLEGMAHPDRARILGDTARSAPETWTFGGPDNPIDVVLMLFAKGREAVKALLARERERLERTAACTEVHAPLDGWLHADGAEHFGFRDGLSQPGVLPNQPDPIKVGEFVFGYSDEYDNLPIGPTLGPEESTRWSDLFGARSQFCENGSYLVFRQLVQEVPELYRFLREKASTPASRGDDKATRRLAAKFVGRWPGGASLVDHPDEDPGPSTHNDFLYAEADPLGHACPLGSHVRRCNPRDALPPDPATSQMVVNRHRLLRRGRPYGPRHPDPMSGESDGRERGLLFLCFNANLRRQFEFVQQTWINNPTFDGLVDDRDPLLGDHPASSTFTIPSPDLRERIHGLTRFVHTRGGAYLFMPGIRALRYLGELTEGIGGRR
jgi:Dyp-type peroxidase family